MANTTAVDLLIKTAQSAANLQEIKKLQSQIRAEMVAIGDDGSEDFQRLARAAAELEGRLGDVRDTIDQMNPDKFSALDSAARIGATGIQVVTGAMALLGDESEDAQKALMKVQAAMAFAQGISQLRDLKKEFANLTKTMLANPILLVVAAVTALGFALYDSWKAAKEYNSEAGKLTRQLEEQKKVTAEIVSQTEREIKLMEAQGASAEDIYVARLKSIDAQIAEAKITLNLTKAKFDQAMSEDLLTESIYKNTAALLRKMGFEDAAKVQEQAALAARLNNVKEEGDAFKEAFENLKNITNDRAVLVATEYKRAADEGKKAREEEEKELAAHDQHRLDLHNEYLKKKQEAVDAELARRRAESDAAKQGLDEWAQAQADALVELDTMQAEHDQRAAEQAKALSALKKRIIGEDLSVASSAFGALAELSGKNAQLQKFFAASQTTVETYLAAQKAFTSQLIPGDPTAPLRAYIAAGAAIVSGFVRVRAILATNMKAPSGASSGGGGSPSFGGPSGFSQEPAGTQPTTQLDANGNVITPNTQQQPQAQQVFMVESQASDVQRRAVMLQQATIVE